MGISDIQQTRDEMALEIMQDFIDAAYYNGCTDLAKKKLEESNELLYKTCKEEELGMKSEPEVAQVLLNANTNHQ
jgi:outer membrane protein